MKKTLIISAFPACGKTFLYKNQEQLLFKSQDGLQIHYSFLDSDSSKFKKYDGWEKEYVNHIEENIGKVDFIFISQHDVVLQEIANRGLPFVTVGPENLPWTTNENKMLTKQQWFGRFVLRDNTHIANFMDWIKKLSENYDSWTSIQQQTKYGPIEFFSLGANQYLSNIIEELYYKKEIFSQYTKQRGGLFRSFILCKIFYIIFFHNSIKSIY